MLASLHQPQGSVFYLRSGPARWGVKPAPWRGPSRSPAMSPHPNPLSPTLVVICEFTWARGERTQEVGARAEGKPASSKHQGMENKTAPPRCSPLWVSKPRRILLLLKPKSVFPKHNMQHLLFTFQSKHLPVQLYKLYRIENSIAERNVGFVIRALSLLPPPFSMQTGTNWTENETWWFKRLKLSSPCVLSLVWFSLSFQSAEDTFASWRENTVCIYREPSSALGTKPQVTQIPFPFFRSSWVYQVADKIEGCLLQGEFCI